MGDIARETDSGASERPARDSSLRRFREAKMAAFHEVNHQLQMRYFKKVETEGMHYFRRFIPKQHMDFYNKLPFVILASADKDENIWVTAATAQPGKQMMEATNEHVTFSNIDQLAAHGDPALEDLEDYQPVGMLGIELHTRRRNRLGGVVRILREGKFQLGGPIISYGNCPQYITERNWQFVETEGRRAARVTTSTKLTSEQRGLIGEASTFFIGTGHPATGLEASHRGGAKGFVRVIDSETLMFPDFPGNHMLKTLGNIVANGKIGLWFGNFERASTIQITGSAYMLWGDSGEDRKKISELFRVAVSKPTAFFPDNLNWVVVKIRKVVSRENSMTVTWKLRDDYIDLTVTKMVQESKDVKSFYLSKVSIDAKGERTIERIPPPIPGQYLPIFVSPPEHAFTRGLNSKHLDRTYTISGFSSTHYRLTVKKVRGGKVSSWLHESVKPGQIIQSREPQGHFVLQSKLSKGNTRTIGPAEAIVFISAGIGITPLVPILNQVVELAELENKEKRPKVVWIHGTQTPSDLPLTLQHEVTKLLHQYVHKGFGKAVRHLQFSRSSIDDLMQMEQDGFDMENSNVNEEQKVRKYFGKGRLNVTNLKDIFDKEGFDPRSTHIYTCGPSTFMGMLSRALRGYPHVFSETFGPSAAAK
eukprot:CAMPEP_0114492638 /NCGR_PEP_ID=MMETSP0109-20121206/3668_1 /TAXON_ID=29199 /ORGANISM="Chlorarachnion reptans, Strain CCCM449" /LENGTH=647 /DNA_ID=CAMNT_0001669507 /DNA_START=389 /DNA_END=2332 /DNA_ORIENTATION=+